MLTIRRKKKSSQLTQLIHLKLYRWLFADGELIFPVLTVESVQNVWCHFLHPWGRVMNRWMRQRNESVDFGRRKHMACMYCVSFRVSWWRQGANFICATLLTLGVCWWMFNAVYSRMAVKCILGIHLSMLTKEVAKQPCLCGSLRILNDGWSCSPAVSISVCMYFSLHTHIYTALHV